MDRIAVIAGGAAHGAEVVGKLTKLRRNYNVFIGTSTGALISLLLACEKYEQLDEEYLNATNKDMYGFNLFKNGKLNKKRILFAFPKLFFKPYLFNLSERIEQKVRDNFSKEDFERLNERGVKVVVTVKPIDYKNAPTLFVSNLDNGMYYDKFVKFVTASAAIPFLAKPIEILGERYVDGGVQEPIPTAYLNKYTDAFVDIWLMHSKRDLETALKPIKNGFDLAGRLFGDMRNEILEDDLNVKKATIHYSSYKDWSSADFDTEKMREIWERGRNAV